MPILVARASASSIAWVVITSALRFPMCFIPFHITRRAPGSTPADASSIKQTAGSPIRAIAQLSLRLLPPLS